MEKFVLGNAVPLLDEVSGENYPMYSQSGLPLAYLFIDPAAEDKDTQLNAIKPVASKHKGVINFVWIDATKYGDHAKSLNVKREGWPAFVIQDMKDGLKYPLTSEPTFAAVDDFVDMYAAGQLQPSLKSEAVPEKNEDPVTVVVGLEYDKYVLDDEKDVLIEFYAPW